MSRRSDPVVVWEAARPLPARQVLREAAWACVYHYRRLAILATTGKDPLK